MIILKGAACSDLSLQLPGKVAKEDRCGLNAGSFPVALQGAALDVTAVTSVAKGIRETEQLPSIYNSTL